MNILTLSIKQKYFDEILAGKKTHEMRELIIRNGERALKHEWIFRPLVRVV